MRSKVVLEGWQMWPTGLVDSTREHENKKSSFSWYWFCAQFSTCLLPHWFLTPLPLQYSNTLPYSSAQGLKARNTSLTWERQMRKNPKSALTVASVWHQALRSVSLCFHSSYDKVNNNLRYSLLLGAFWKFGECLKYSLFRERALPCSFARRIILCSPPLSSYGSVDLIWEDPVLSDTLGTVCPCDWLYAATRTKWSSWLLSFPEGAPPKNSNILSVIDWDIYRKGNI